ncbi:MAG: hypothetical protein IAE97_00250 [Chthoniobacterales bacterium]|nr:hypothetical protein [Chthoniobacterales bacterium]
MTAPTQIAEAFREGKTYDHVFAKSEALFLGWTEAFAPVLADHEVIEVESEFTYPLLNPETEAASRTFVEAGKIDGLLRHKASGRLRLLEHKTTGDGLEPDSDYWPKLAMDSQISGYILGLHHRGFEVNDVLYDVVRKPAHRPSNIPLLDDTGTKIVLDASGQRVRTKDGKKWRESADSALGYVLQTREETPVEYHRRVLGEMRENPAKYFVQKEIPRLDSDLLEYMQDAWAISQQVLYFRKAGLWPRNPSACTAFGTCEFFALCSGRASVDGVRFRPKQKAHSELETVPGELEFLTNSRKSALRKCSRYHFLRYEEPTEPVSEQEEALRIGTIFHALADLWLRTFIKPQS